MYVDMLVGALDAWDLQLSSEELLDHALDCRVRMLATGTAHGASAFQALAAEVAYDRALIHLCNTVGIGTAPGEFHQPQAERSRLEQCLAGQVDVDLVALSRARRGEWNPPPGSDSDACLLW
jgi:hypothetical protein